MNIVDQIYMGLIYVWSHLDKVALEAGVTGLIVALLRMRKRGKIVWSEALLCGIFATIAYMGAAFIIALVGIPADSWLMHLTNGGSTVVGAAIGWYGTERTVAFLEDKVKGDSNETDR